MKRAFLTVLSVACFLLTDGETHAQASENPGAATYNPLILAQIRTMPLLGGYSASHEATARLRGSVALSSMGLNVAASAAQPSYCSGATYLVFLKTVDALIHQGVIAPGDRDLAALLITGQRDGEGVWGRWNANGPGTARLFYEMGLGRNFSDISLAQAGDFMKIWWSVEVGKRERGHSVIFLGTERVDGVDSVRFWSSNTGLGYGEKVVPRAKIKAALFSRLQVPQNLTRAAALSPRVDPYLARLLTTDSSVEQAKAASGL